MVSYAASWVVHHQSQYLQILAKEQTPDIQAKGNIMLLETIQNKLPYATNLTFEPKLKSNLKGA